MKLANIIRRYKKNYPNNYKYLSRRLDQAKDTEEKARIYIAASTLICFSMGMLYDSIVYAFSAANLLLAANLLSLFIYAATTLLYFNEKFTISVALAILLITVQMNISVSIYHNYTTVIENNKFIVSHDLFLSFLVCILASLSLGKNQVYILCVMPVCSLATALIIRSSDTLIQHLPSFCLAYISPPVLLTHIRMFLWDTFRKKEQLLSEKKSICRLMGINETQWDLLIDIIQKPHAPRKQTEKLFEQIQEAIGNRLVIRAKRLMVSEELIGQINEKYRFSLTANEIRLCCLILEDKSISEISHILYINESSVRANRSRIRKKMGLGKETNLKAHLLMLVGREKEYYSN